MIRESIGVNSVVWNKSLGYGKFKGWEDYEHRSAYVAFRDGTVRAILKKMLTEIVGVSE